MNLLSPQRFLGTYPEMCFTEEPVEEAIKTFRKKLDKVTYKIKSRNEDSALAYGYLSPDKIPNSVAIWKKHFARPINNVNGQCVLDIREKNSST